MCHALPALSHGTVRTSSSNLTVGMVATYACNRGYDLNGKANMNTYTRKCIQTHTISDCDGEWTEDIPQCIGTLTIFHLVQKNYLQSRIYFSFKQRNARFRKVLLTAVFMALSSSIQTTLLSVVKQGTSSSEILNFTATMKASGFLIEQRRFLFANVSS